MLELIQITNDATLASTLAQSARELGPIRLMVDLESLGKAERQAGRNTFISAHQWRDVAQIRQAAPSLPLMVRVNPMHEGSAAEVERALSGGADRLMLPMFRTARGLSQFTGLVADRVPVTALLETADALDSLADWVATPGLDEVFVGLNDLHLSLRQPFMFAPLADGTVERVAGICATHGKRFGFGGIARMDEGLLPGRAVLAEHVRVGSRAVILSRTFHRFATDAERMAAWPVFALELRRLRETERALALRNEAQRANDAERTRSLIESIAQDIAARTRVAETRKSDAA
jgi:2-keto-3-deoxy-L-rhamnonate aldolase RhmA